MIDEPRGQCPEPIAPSQGCEPTLWDVGRAEDRTGDGIGACLSKLDILRMALQCFTTLRGHHHADGCRLLRRIRMRIYSAPRTS